MLSAHQTNLYKALHKHVLSQEDFEADDFPTVDSAKKRKETFECYRCNHHYSGEGGQCTFHAGSFVVRLPARHMGLVVGRGGATVARIARQSGARLDVGSQGGGGVFREVGVQGGEGEVGQAERMLQEVLEGKARLEGGRWRCCGAGRGSKACGSSVSHVRNDNFLDRRMLVTAEERQEEGKVFAMDCEMVKSWRGGELAKVTVLDHEGKVCYETLVQPPVQIGDYNTKYSGITPQMLQGVATGLGDVQDDLVKMISAKDIIIGHSLNCDLKALHLAHRKVVDTSILFPHPEGPPKRMSLKNLTKKHLMRDIQCKEGGHDSKEDALAALDLVKYKVL